MRSRSHEVALEGIEIYNMQAKRVEILSGRDVGARMSRLFVGRTKRKKCHEVVVITISELYTVRCIGHLRADTRHEGVQGTRWQCRYERKRADGKDHA
jgi:hypothetical protein